MLAFASPRCYIRTKLSETKPYMKKLLTAICIIASTLLILDSFQAGPALVMFLMLGIIPGTSTSLEPGAMLQIIALIAGFTLSRIALAAFVGFMSNPSNAQRA